MVQPQPAIFAEGASHHYFVEYAISPGGSPDTILDAVRTVRREAAARPEVQVVLAFGRALWEHLAPDRQLDGLEAFTAIDGWQGHGAPATQRDLWVWIQGAQHDANFDLALTLHRTLAPVAEVALDVHGFVYQDSRDLTGFIDGTANPTGDDARAAALVPDGQPRAGGGFLLTQRWVHDLTAFNGLSVEEQERVIGRTKPDSVELTGDAMPPNSHVSRTDLTHDGVPVKIFRRSTPYGTLGEHGLYFVAFACDLDRFSILLKSMFGANGDGQHDRLIEFSTPVTGSYWFAPSADDLATL